MAKLARLSVTAVDGGLGILGPDATGRIAAIGCAGASVALKEVLTFGDPDTAHRNLKTGPLRDFVTTALTLAGTTCYAYALAPATTTGAAAVAKTTDGGGTQTPTIKAGSIARSAYDIVIRITAPGARGAAEFQLSIDGAAWGAETVVPGAPGEYEIPDTGITVVFPEDGTPADSYATGDVFTVTSKYPQASGSDVLAAVETLMRDPTLDFETIAVTGPSAAGFWSGLSMKLAELRPSAAQGVPRWVYVQCQAAGPAADTAAWVTAQTGAGRGSTVDARLLVHGGWCRAADAVTGRQDVRPSMDTVAGRIAGLQPWVPPDWVRLGQLTGVTELHPADLTDVQIAALQAAGYAMLRRHFGLRGVYVARGQMLVEATSDFGAVERRRVMDYACRRVYAAQLRHLNSAVTLAADGQPEGLELFLAESERPLREMQAEKWISSYSLDVLRGNILADETLRTRIRIVPLGKASQIETEVAYRNPLLAAQAAGEEEADGQ